MSKRQQPDEWLATLLPPRKFAHEPPLPGGPVTTGDALLEIPLASLDANPYQTRTALNEKSLDELADSIRSLGLLEPIVVPPNTAATRSSPASAASRPAISPACMRCLPSCATSPTSRPRR